MGAFGPQTYIRFSSNPQFERARDLIAKTVLENMLIGSIAKNVDLCAYALIRRFKKSYGISPDAWRIQVRQRRREIAMR
jgi:transcriptional regulator GlxA family with amidase domain